MKKFGIKERMKGIERSTSRTQRNSSQSSTELSESQRKADLPKIWRPAKATNFG